MLILNGEDLLESLTPNQLIETVESAFTMYEGEEFHMPPRVHADYEGNVLLLMPSFNPGSFGTKLVTVFPGNQEKGSPVIQGVMVLNDADTGRPIAIMDAAVLTSLRTGAVGATGIKHLAPANVRTMGVIGAGIQAWQLVLQASELRPFEKIFVSDIIRSKAVNFADNLRKRLDLEVEVVDSGPGLLNSSDVIVTATTSLSPVLPDRPELLKGKTFVGVGSFKPEMREYPEELYPLLESVYIDSRQAVEESGDLSYALGKGMLQKSQIKTLGSIIIDPPEIAEGSTMFFKTVGMALFDLVVAQKIYDFALSSQSGRHVDFP